MNTIIVTNQQEFYALPESFDAQTQIKIVGELYKIDRTPENSDIIICGHTYVRVVRNSVRISRVCDSVRIDIVCGSSHINRVGGFAYIGRVYSSASIDRVYGHAHIAKVYGYARINGVYGSAYIYRVYGCARIQRVYGSARIDEVYGHTIINKVYGSTYIYKIFNSAIIYRVYDSAFVCEVSGHTVIKRISKNAIVVLDKDSKAKVLENINNNVFTNHKQAFLKIYKDQIKDNYITLFKSVDPETECDFWTGKIKYDNGAIVEPKKWDSNPMRPCGDGLHLSPTPKDILKYNKGKIKVCKVHIDDFVVFYRDFAKVRCKKVHVIGDWV